MKTKIFLGFVVLISVLSCEKEDGYLINTNKLVFENSFDTISYRSGIITTKFQNPNGIKIVSYGHCWSTEKDPTIEDENTNFDFNSNTITSEMLNLEHNTQYYVRTYIEFEDLIYYSDSNIIFKTKEILVPDVSVPVIARVSLDYSKVTSFVDNSFGCDIISKGICWAVDKDPTVEDFICYDEGEADSFSCIINELEIGAKYYLRSFAINEIGIGYSQSILLEFDWGTLQIKDYDGNWYNTVKIENQVWMRENLKTTHYADGTAIEDGSEIIDLNITDKYWMVPTYEIDKDSYIETYGLLYTWAAATGGSVSSNTNPSNVQGVCPDGWHLPSDSEWDELAYLYGGGILNVGGPLKQTGTKYWNAPNAGATNESGFTALPAAFKEGAASYSSIGNYAYFWTSTEFIDDASYAMSRACTFLYASLYHQEKIKNSGFSVRCIKD